MESIGGHVLRSLAILFLCSYLLVSADTKCSLGCQGSASPLLKFANGEVYKYQLEGSTTTHLSGAKTVPVKLGISAAAEISALPQCTYSLKLSKVVVTSSDDKKYDNLKELEAHPIQFSYQGGQVGTKVCIEEGDSHVSINIKRAIISLFQVATVKESGQAADMETDVFGICPTIFNYKTEGKKVTIQKTRNLNSCGHRETLDLAFLSTPYYSKSDFQSTPLLKAAFKSEQKIEDGVIKSANSHETYNYRPLASADSGAEITVNTKITFVSKASGAAPALKSAKSGSIIFQAPLPADGISNSDAIIKALKQVVASVEPAVSFTAARSFGSLVSVLRHAKKADILATYSQVKSGAGFPNKEIVKQVFLDALFRAGSSEAVEAGAELLKNQEISEAYAKLWYLSFSFTKHASPAALKSVSSILDGKNVPRQAYLGIGALANRHVREYGIENPAELDALLLKLAAPLKSGEKADTIEKENNVIASLKGLQNVQYLSPEVANTVSKIAADPKIRSRIRTIAIETLKSDPCQKTAKETVTSILKNIDEDAELRIKAYLALIQCPCSKSADALKEIIDKEQIKQVGSFIVSHLRNLRASANPDKFEQKNRYGGIVPARKFPINPAKYSYSVELSYLLDSLNVGVAGDSNVIYSQHSFVPRSYSLNLTTHVFGQAFNLFELDIRNENLDFLLEKYFGPKGYFKSKDHNALMEDGISKASGIIDKIKARYEKSIRPKRAATQADLDSLAKKVDLGIDANYNGLDLDVALKVFGTEITWFDYHSDKSSISSGKLIDQFFDSVDASIDKAKNYEFDYKKHLTFLDNEISYPTGLGFPLKLKALGSSAISVKVDGKLDIPALIKDPQNANIRYQFIPSAAVEVSALLTIDAYAVESGIKLATTVHSATGVDVTAKILEGNGVDIKLGLPVKVQDVVNIKSEVYSTVAVRGQPEIDVPVKFNVKRQEYGGCFDQLSPIVGLTFCGIVEFPWDGYKVLNPIFGPTTVSIRVEKEDDTLTSYNFRAFYNNKKPHARSLEVILDTPNSQTNRKLSLLIDGATEPKKELTLNLDTPFKKVAFHGFITDTDKESSLNAKLLNDDAEYFLKLGVDISGSANSRRYQPILEYRAPEGKERLIGRKGTKEKKQQLSLEGAIIVDRKDNSPYRKYKFSELTLITQRGKYVVDGTIIYDTGLLDTDLKVTNEKNVVIIKNKAQKLGNKHYKADAQVSSSQYPDFAVAVNWEYKCSDNHVDHSIIVVHGPDPKSTSARVSLIQSFDFKSGKEFEVATKNKLTYPVLGIEGKFDGQVTPKSLNYDVEAAYENQKVSSKFNSKINTKEVGDYNVYLDAKALTNSIVIESKREIVENRGKSQIANSVTLTPGGKYSLNGAVTHKFDKGNVEQGVDVELTMPQDPKSIKVDVGFKKTPTDLATHAKITAGPTNYIDFASQGTTVAGKPKGDFKLFILSVVTSNGAFSYDGNKYLGSISIDIPKLKRAIDGKAEITHSGGKAAGFAEVQYDAKNDPNKKVRLETNYDVNKEKGYHFNSKNVVFVNADKYIANVNYGHSNGLLADGQVSFDSELVLPSTRKYTAKYMSERNLGGKDKNFKIDAGITHAANKDAAPCKAHLKVSAKNIDLKTGAYEGQSELEIVSSDQKDIKIAVNGKKSQVEETTSVSGQISVQGSLVSHPINGKFDSDTNGSALKGKFVESNFHVALAVGSEFQFNAAQKVAKESYSNEFSAKFPQSNVVPISSVKFNTVNNFNSVAKAAGKPLKIKSANSIYYTDKSGEKFLKVDGDFTEVAKGGIVSLQYSTNEITPRQLTGSFHYDSADTYKGDASLAIKKGEQEGKLVVSGEIYKNIFGGSVKASGQNLYGNGQGAFDFDAVHKYNKEKKSSSTDIKADVNGKAIALSHLAEWNMEKPIFDISLKVPTGENRFYIKAEKKDIGHFTVESKINWLKDGGGSLTADGEGKIVSSEDFFFKYNIDSPKLNINKIHVDVANKPSKDEANKITFSVRSGDKNLVSGSSSYKLAEEGPKLTLDGSGTLKIDAKSYPMNFQFFRQKLSTEVDGEEGRLMKFNFEAKEVPVSYNAYSKISNKEMVHKYKYCHKDQCDKMEATSKIKSSDVLEFEHELFVNFDMALLAKVEGLGLRATTTVSAKALTIDQNVVLQLNAADRLQYQVYVHKTASGVVLTLPKRVIAAEATYSASTTKSEKVALKYEAAIWLNKGKEPNSKTSVSFIAGASRSPGSYSFASNAELKFVTPALGKDLLVKYRSSVLEDSSKILDSSVEIDIFAQKAQKINIDSSVIHEKRPDGFKLNGLVQIKSKGQNRDSELQWTSSYEKGTLKHDVSAYYVDGKNKKQEYVSKFEASKDKFAASVKVFDVFVFSGVGELKVNQKDYYIGLEKKYEIFGRKYEDNAYLYNDGKFKYIFKWITAGDKAFDVSGGIVLGKQADLNIYFVDGTKNPILEASVLLDEVNFLKPSQKFNMDAFKPLAALTQTEIMTVAKEANKEAEIIVKEISNEIVRQADELKKAQPNFKAVSQNYANQLKALRTEIANDKVLKEIADNVKTAFNEVIELAVVAVEEIVGAFEAIAGHIESLLEKLNESLKRLAPQIEEFYRKFSKSLLEMLDAALKAYVDGVDAAIKLYKKLEPEIKEIFNIINKFTEDIGKIISKTIVQAEKEIRNFVQQFVEQVKSLPVYGMLKEKYEELKKYEIPEQALSVFHEVATALKDSVPTQELKKFIEDLVKYVEKILTRQPVDNAAEMKVLVADAREAFKSILALLPTQSVDGGYVFSKPGPMMPLPSFEPLAKLHEYTSFSFSPMSYLKLPNLPSINSIIEGLRPLSLNAKHILPPHPGWGILVDGAHFFTFDKRHFTFKGSCSYILAQDYKDKNFSLSANIESGKLKSLTLTDSKNTLVMLADGTLQLNGKVSEYPVFSGDFSAWRRYHTLNMRSNAGIKVFCSLNLDTCAFDVSGFYFDKVRGLLGTLNNEDYDDFTLPDNKISSDSAKFANAYKLGSCPDAPAYIHQHSASSTECNAYFASKDSPLTICKPFVDTTPFREACEHTVSSATDKNAAACKIAGAYVASCFDRNIMIELPKDCGSCNIGGTPVAVHESVSVKVPQHSADVIVLLEQLEGNQPIFDNLLTPLVSTLTSDFKQKGITDVNFALIGYSNILHKWPIHYSSKGKLSFDGKPKSLTFTKAPVPEAADTFMKKLYQLKKNVYLEFGKTDSFAALYEAYEYPFRADAATVIVHIIANPERHTPSYYPTSTLYPSAMLAGLGVRLLHYTNVLVTPTKGMTQNGAPATDVIGFDNKAVYKVDNVKESPLVGNSAALKELHYPPDVFSDFVRTSEGLVVSADNFNAAKSDAQKQSIQLISKFIVQSSADKEIHKQCECVLKYGLFPETRCYVQFQSLKNIHM